MQSEGEASKVDDYHAAEERGLSLLVRLTHACFSCALVVQAHSPCMHACLPDKSCPQLSLWNLNHIY